MTSNAGGEVALNHNLTSFASETHHSGSYQMLQPELQHNAPSSFVQGKGQVFSGADAGQTQFTEHQVVGQDQAELSQQEEEPSIDIVINNVVSSFSTRCHLDLKRIAQQGVNVMYRRENGMVSMKIRRPYTTASIWSSGKITCTGARSEEEAKIAARRFARSIQNLGYRVRFCNFRVVNVLGTCSFPFGIRITHFSRDHKENASYEPELHPGVTYKIKPPNKATLKIFSTGSVTVTAPSVHNIQLAIEHIFPLVYEYRMDRVEMKGVQSKEGPMHMMPKSRRPPGARHRPMAGRRALQDSDDSSDGSTDEEEDFDSEESQD